MTLNKWYNFNKYVFEGEIDFFIYSITGKKIGSFYTDDIEAAASSIFGEFEVTKVSVRGDIESLEVELKEPTFHDGCESCVHFDPEKSCDICNKCQGTSIHGSFEYNHKPDMYAESPDCGKREAES